MLDPHLKSEFDYLPNGSRNLSEEKTFPKADLHFGSSEIAKFSVFRTSIFKFNLKVKSCVEKREWRLNFMRMKICSNFSDFLESDFIKGYHRSTRFNLPST